MKKTILFLVTSIIFGASFPDLAIANIIPHPAKINYGEGNFIITADTRIICSKDLAAMENFYVEIIEDAIGFQLKKDKSPDGSVISISIDEKSTLPEEGYTLNISSEKVELNSSSVKGIFYGLQSLRQLVSRKSGKMIFPVVQIEDYPRFSWRGLMLDVSRTFMNPTLVKRYLDLMSYYKLNTLHLHLSDDQGWRVEIKRYPRLTTVGSKFDSEFNEMGGYYTQDDIRELVKYAASRNITIVPEFELPGHECAAIASYPELSCAGVRPKIHPFFMGTGIHKEIFCAGKDEVYEFVFNVIDELVELFPSPIIHIGGDEAPKDEWKKCSHCQQKMKENNLANEEELQSYFVTTVGDYLSKKGRRIIGWDEILDGGKLKGNEILMYWRGWLNPTWIKEAAKKGFEIVSCPTTHCYFDYINEHVDSKRVYSYDPVPDDVSPELATKYIGVQANFWSHIDRNEKGIDKQLFPRLFALSEVAWSKPESKDWERFKKSAVTHNEKLRRMEVNCFYDKSIYNPY